MRYTACCGGDALPAVYNHLEKFSVMQTQTIPHDFQKNNYKIKIVITFAFLILVDKNDL